MNDVSQQNPFDITDKPLEAADLSVVTEGFDADTASKGAPAHALHECTILKRDTSGKVIGCMNGRSWWNWFYIDMLWVDPAYQKQGLGKKLVAAAEAEAIKRGCIGCYLWTQSFQAPDFYSKVGYQKFVVMPDFPVGHQRIGFMKRLAT